IVEGNAHLAYLPRKIVEKDNTFKQIVTYVAVVKNGSVLCYERGAYSAVQNELVGRKSIGFGGHISETDYDLFSIDTLGVFANARRELWEELSLPPSAVDYEPRIIGLINDNSTAEGNRHLAIAMMYQCAEHVDPVKSELEIRNLHWKPLVGLPNDIDLFE